MTTPSVPQPLLATLERLDREWAQLASRPSVLRQVDGWQVFTTPLVDLDDLLRRIGFRAAGQPAADTETAEVSNEVFGQVVRRASTDPLAARIALQRLLPGLVTLARRRLGTAQRFDELVAGAWTAIRTFNPCRRARYFAPTLLHDANYHAFTREARRQRCSAVVMLPEIDDYTPIETGLEAPFDAAEMIDAAERRGVLLPGDRTLLEGMLAGRAAAADAGGMGVSERTVRYRRADLIRRLRDAFSAHLATTG